MDAFLSICFSLIIIVYIVLVLFVFVVIKNTDYKRTSFYYAIVNVYSKKLNLDESLNQLRISFNYIHNRDNDMKMENCFENYIALYDTWSEEKFNRFFKTSKSDEIREFIVDLLKNLHDKYPFSQLNEQEAIILININNFAKKTNFELIEQQLNELEKELRRKDNIILKAKKENKISFTVSIVGIILTVFFGVLSFL